MREQLQEIFATISRNKLRTFLTGFSVAWGIFMLVILLGSGNGLQNGVKSNFAGRAKNQVRTYGGRTSMPHQGYQPDRRIDLKLKDKEKIKESNPNITDIAGVFFVGGRTINYGKEFTSVTIVGVETIYESIQGVTILEGRFISKGDVNESRKVIVLEENCAKTVSPRKSLIGKDVIADRIIYKVIGIYKTPDSGYSSNALAPLSTIQKLYSRDNTLHTITYLVDGIKTVPESKEFDQNVRSILAAEHAFNPEDNRAVGINNVVREFMMLNTVFNGIAIFIWIIGLGTLLAGVVGVSNIMLVTVRERTSEFGIRKSMGATPGSLVRLVLAESILITAIFGYLGMILGIGVMEIANIMIDHNIAANPGKNMVIFLNPTLNLSIIFSATLVLVIAGVVAGYIPARRAARLKTIDAMRYNK